MFKGPRERRSEAFDNINIFPGLWPLQVRDCWQRVFIILQKSFQQYPLTVSVRWHLWLKKKKKKTTICQRRRCKRPGFNPWVGKIPWRRERQPTPEFLPGESHEQMSLVCYSPWGRKESDMTKATCHAHIYNLSFLNASLVAQW